MNARPRIVILSAFLTPYRSGAEAMVEEVAMRLSDRYEITVVTSKLSSRLPRRDRLSESIDVRRVGLGMSIDKWLFPLLAPLAARRAKPEIVHAVLESYAGFALVLCHVLLPRAKRVLTLQSTNTSLFLRLMHRFPHAITAISAALLMRAARFGRPDAMYIPNGIDGAAIDEALARVTRDEHAILFVGRLESMKGIDTLLDVFALVDDQKATLRIVGSGGLEGELKEIARNHPAASRITFTGRLDPKDVYREYARATIFCGLSRREAMGNVFLEAQASGCAVVATSVDGIPEIVKDRKTGLLVPPDDPKAAAAAIHSLLRDAHLRSSLTQAAVVHARAFEWDAIAKRYADVYGRVLKAND